MTWPTVVGLVSSGIALVAVAVALVRWAVRLPKRVITAVTEGLRDQLGPIHFEVSENGGSGSLKDQVLNLKADTAESFTRVENHLRRQDRKIASLQSDVEELKG